MNHYIIQFGLKNKQKAIILLVAIFSKKDIVCIFCFVALLMHIDAPKENLNK